MLTKKEAVELCNSLLFQIHYDDNDTHVRRCVKRFTEKSKREIQIGDIYRDGNGNYETVKIVTSDHFYTSPYNKRYDLNGVFDEAPKMPCNNLDLSRRYKIVEVTDE